MLTNLKIFLVFNMKAIVTGGVGFIWSHLVDHLLYNIHEVVVIDNFSISRIENLQHVKNKIKIITFDLNSCDRLFVNTDLGWLPLFKTFYFTVISWNNKLCNPITVIITLSIFKFYLNILNQRLIKFFVIQDIEI